MNLHIRIIRCNAAIRKSYYQSRGWSFWLWNMTTRMNLQLTDTTRFGQGSIFNRGSRSQHQSKRQLPYLYTVQDLYSRDKQAMHMYELQPCNRLVVGF